MKRKGAAKMGLPEIIILVVVLLMAYKLGAFDVLLGVEEPTEPAVPGAVEGWCAVEDVSVTFDAVEKYNAGNAVTGSIFYTVNGDPYKVAADGSTVTMSPGDNVVAYFSLNGTDHYATKVEDTIPCQGTYTIRGDVYKNQSLTITIWNTDGTVNDGSGADGNQSLSAGDVKNIAFKIEGTYETGAPYGYRIVCEANSTAYDELDLRLDAGYGTATVAEIPHQFNVASAKNDAYAWDIPAIISNEEIKGKITVDVSDSNDPTPVAANQIKCYLYDYDYFLKDDGTFGLGVEDSDDWSDVGDTQETMTIYVS